MTDREGGPVTMAEAGKPPTIDAVLHALKEMDQELLAEWLKQVLGGAMGIAKFGRDVTPNSLVQAVFEEASASLREALASAALRLLDSVAADDNVDFHDGCAHGLLMLVNPVFTRSEVRDEAGAALLALVRSPSLADNHPASIRRLALQGLLELGTPLSREFWLEQYGRDAVRYGRVVFVALCQLDLNEAMRWLARWPDERSRTEVLLHLLPGLSSELGKEQLASAVWRALPWFSASSRTEVVDALEEVGLGRNLVRGRWSVTMYEDLIEDAIRHFPAGIQEKGGVLAYLQELGLDYEPRKRDRALLRVVTRWQPYASPVAVSLRIVELVLTYPNAVTFACVVHHLSVISENYKELDPESESIGTVTGNFPTFLIAAIDIALRIPRLGKARASRTKEAVATLAQILVDAIRDGHLKWKDEVATVLAIRFTPQAFASLLFDFIARDEVTDGTLLATVESFRPAQKVAIQRQLARLITDALNQDAGREARRRLGRAFQTLSAFAPEAFAALQAGAMKKAHEASLLAPRTLQDELGRIANGVPAQDDATDKITA